MRISKIELSWFRGAAEIAELDTRSKSIAIYGANGAGKSCFVDAVEYTLRGGRIEHLAHEYSGKHQEKAVLNTHKPADAEPCVAITLSDKTRVEVSITANGSCVITPQEGVAFLALDCARTVLRQDEVSHFIHSTKGEKYSVLLPLLGLGHLELAAENFRQLAKAVRKESRSNEAAIALKSARAHFERAFEGEVPASSSEAIVKLCEAFVSEVHEHEPDVCAALAAEALEERLTNSSALERQQVALEKLGSADLKGGITRVRAAAADLAQVADQAVQDQVKVLQAAQNYLRATSDESLVCPACGSEIERTQMDAHVRAELKRLENAIEKSATYREHIGALATLADQVVAACKSDEIKRWGAAASDARIPKWINAAAAVEVPRDRFTEDDLKELQNTLGAAIMAAAAAASFLPPAATDLARANERLHAATNLRSASQRAAQGKAAEDLAAQVSALEDDIRADIKKRSQEVIGAISADIQRMWTILHPGEPIEDVRLHVPSDTEKAIDIGLKFYGKALASPRLTLSEGYRNSLGLCVFLAMAARYGDGDTPVILDDVIVSLDRGHRGMVVDLLEAEFSDRQVLLFTHDRDWYADLRQQLSGSAWTFRALLPYSSPQEGIRWSERTGTMDDARAYLDTRPDTAANEARKAMDVELAMYAERLELKLSFARGAKNDRRTGHDFLTELIAVGQTAFQRKVGDKYEPFREAVEAFRAADQLLLTWANRGSHTEDVTPGEAEKLIDVCSTALDFLSCRSCAKPVTFAETRSGHRQCQCGTLRWK